MTSTWVVGDIHGCADELALLLETLDLQPGDRFLSAGDLFHRGPDPVGVLRTLQNLGSAFDMVLGNHEWALLNRVAATGRAGDLRGDNKAKMDPSALPASEELLAFLQNRKYFLRGPCTGPAWEAESTSSDPASSEATQRDWILVHGSVIPGRKVEDMQPSEIVRLSRCFDRPGAPLWHTEWQGPEFIAFGHAQSAAGMHASDHGTPLAYGLDTGCVYGGKLTAIRLEDLKVVQQPALKKIS
ncbi:MAG: metallophosphoesterase [Planctomycetota bacterium]|nr:metallophosphoesterase [Planctomycetota bacterium]